MDGVNSYIGNQTNFKSTTNDISTTETIKGVEVGCITNNISTWDNLGNKIKKLKRNMKQGFQKVRRICILINGDVYENWMETITSP
jgi:hypothetical protein